MNENNIIDIFNRKKYEEEIINDIAAYLMEKYQNRISYDDALEIANILYNQEFLDRDNVYSGEYDDIIHKTTKAYIMRRESTHQNNVEKKEVPLQSIRKFVNKDFVKGAIITVSAAAIFFTFSSFNKDAGKIERKTDSNLGKLASAVGSSDYKKGISIVNQNAYRIQSSNSANSSLAYYHDRIALDIISVCTKDPQLFEICLNNVYSDMNYNRLENMDEIFKFLKIYMASDEALTPLYEKIADCDVFLDYIIKAGYLKPDSKDYDKIVEDIAKYKSVKDSYNEIGHVFSNLNSDSQKRIENLMTDYRNNKKNLQKENIEIIEKALEQQILDDGAPKLGGN